MPSDKSRMPEQKEVHSGDRSGMGRPRRDDGDVFPQHRSSDEMGTHGGPKKGAVPDPGMTYEDLESQKDLKERQLSGAGFEPPEGEQE